MPRCLLLQMCTALNHCTTELAPDSLIPIRSSCRGHVSSVGAAAAAAVHEEESRDQSEPSSVRALSLSDAGSQYQRLHS
ncbi:hypothetical protein WMY93_016132 [Mugilogobius chulae]|uniref:Secreted protein n=1 Tax=Mugilogobius chulae TaxID=88201 RepID=A0AAW0NSL8_9GOBI